MALPYEPLLVYGLPSLFVGLGTGYMIGAQETLGARDRIGLCIIIGLIGGMIIALLTSTIRPPESVFHYLLSILSFIFAAGFGAATNWAPVPRRLAHHVIFEPDDDEEFDREIRSALDEKE